MNNTQTELKSISELTYCIPSYVSQINEKLKIDTLLVSTVDDVKNNHDDISCNYKYDGKPSSDSSSVVKDVHTMPIAPLSHSFKFEDIHLVEDYENSFNSNSFFDCNDSIKEYDLELPSLELLYNDFQSMEGGDSLTDYCKYYLDLMNDEIIADEIYSYFDANDEHDTLARILAGGTPFGIDDYNHELLQEVDLFPTAVTSSSNIVKHGRHEKNLETLLKCQSKSKNKRENKNTNKDKDKKKETKDKSDDEMKKMDKYSKKNQKDKSKDTKMKKNVNSKKKDVDKQSKDPLTPSTKYENEIVGLESKEMYTIYRMIEYLKVISNERDSDHNQTLLQIFENSKNICYELHKLGSPKYYNLPGLIFETILNKIDGKDFLNIYNESKICTHPNVNNLRIIESKLNYRLSVNDIFSNYDVEENDN